ncbi:MAG: double-strand break repair helicase AddA [Pseudomonadota bacterium]
MLIKTTNLQNSASNPANSVFVSASAGSGKTKVLTDRVLRLLLSGVAPAKILCLTFTKVAAAQMQKRIFAELENWVLWSEEKLQEHLAKFTSKKPSQFEIQTARQLFATLLDDNSGLQISTIHSFCQSIIKKFPVEAKTSPSFTVIDPQKENELLFAARKKLLEQALLDENLAKKIQLISSRLNENSFLEITAEIIRKRQNLAELKEKYFDIAGVIDQIYSELNVDLKADEETVFIDFTCDKNWSKDNLLLLCHNTEIKSKKAIEQFINQPHLDNLEEYLKVFLTSENEPRKQLTTKPIQKQIAQAEEIMRFEQERILQFLEKSNSTKIAVATSSLLIVVDKIIEIYNQLKNQNGYLDYSDLIIKTSLLLENSAQREWVKYKLDGIYEHILVDESQDTNHWQWNIVKAISEEFFAGGDLLNQSRTIFIVGDEKQSIYSFQGADPNIFANIFYYYQDRLAMIDQQFLNVELNSSFRSMPAILQVVDLVFAKAELANSISTLATKIQHHAIKNQHFGKVELMPIISRFASTPGYSAIKEEEKYQWDLDFSIDEEYKAQEILAQIIARKIKKFFDDGKFLASKNRFAEFGDVMILLKERKSNLANLLVKHLSAQQIPVSSADRIDFSKNIIVQDLLALAQFILLPEDDLNLACLLKSPLFGVSEEELLAACELKNSGLSLSKESEHKTISLFSALKHQIPIIHQKLSDLIEQNLERQFSVLQFFSYCLIEKGSKKAILARFGKAGEEIINQFFKTIIDYQSNNIATSLQNFVQFLMAADLEIKIDSSGQNQNQVYITTVHSAKGLEAPIVFLADSFHSAQKQFGNDRRRIFWDQKSGLPFWSSGKNSDNQIIKNIKTIDRQITKKEYWRQLYVAMTRAEEELYICGFGKEIGEENCWYNAIKNAMIDQAKEVENFLGEEYQDYLVGKTLLIGGDALPINIPSKKSTPTIIPSNYDYNFINQFPDVENSEEFLYPSRTDLTNQINSSKADLGKIIHRILEILPNLKINDLEERRKFLSEYLQDKNLPAAEIDKIIHQINEVLTKHHDLFNHPNSQAEVPIIATINGKTVSAKIDLLIIEKNEVLIIDFKTGTKNSDSDPHHQSQLQLYEQALQKLYPDKKIKSQIIWV